MGSGETDSLQVILLAAVRRVQTSTLPIRSLSTLLDCLFFVLSLNHTHHILLTLWPSHYSHYFLYDVRDLDKQIQYFQNAPLGLTLSGLEMR